jgi:tRNA (guanine37-N1)-methyltransferase
MKFSIITLFPEMIEAIFSQGILSQAREKKIIEVEAISPRTATQDAHRTVDDRPFGGGDGMVMMAEPLTSILNKLH